MERRGERGDARLVHCYGNNMFLRQLITDEPLLHEQEEWRGDRGAIKDHFCKPVTSIMNYQQPDAGWREGEGGEKRGVCVSKVSTLLLQ
jgi:hypothetical protein